MDNARAAAAKMTSSASESARQAVHAASTSKVTEKAAQGFRQASEGVRSTVRPLELTAVVAAAVLQAPRLGRVSGRGAAGAHSGGRVPLCHVEAELLHSHRGTGVASWRWCRRGWSTQVESMRRSALSDQPRLESSNHNP